MPVSFCFSGMLKIQLNERSELTHTAKTSHKERAHVGRCDGTAPSRGHACQNQRGRDAKTVPKSWHEENSVILREFM